MALELNGTTGVSLVQDGVVTAADLASGAITSAALPAGSVLQVQSTYVASTAHISTTSSTFQAAGYSVSITPTSIDSTIVIQMFNPMVHHSNATINGKMYVNGSAMSGANNYHLGYQDSTGAYASWCFAGTYSPTSLSQLTFEPYFRSENNGSAVRFSHENSSLTLIAMEVAG
jgi:hypothetical protein